MFILWESHLQSSFSGHPYHCYGCRQAVHLHDNQPWDHAVQRNKGEALSIRTTAEIKNLIRQAAERERR